MSLTLSYNDKKKGIELLFSKEPSQSQSAYLKRLGFKEAYKQPLKWCAARHPAYIAFANALKETLLKGGGFKEVLIQPSYTPSQENIDHNKFSYITISFLKEGKTVQESHVLFDPYKKVATEIATRYGQKKYGDAFQAVAVDPRNHKRKARALLEEGKVIKSLEPVSLQQEIHRQPNPASVKTAPLGNTFAGRSGKTPEQHLAEFDQYVKEESLEQAAVVLADFIFDMQSGHYQEYLPEVLKRIETKGIKPYLRTQGRKDFSKVIAGGDFINGLKTNLWNLLPAEFKTTRKAGKITWQPDPADPGLQRLVAGFTGTDEIRPEMMGVYFDEEGIIATNAIRLLFLKAVSSFKGLYCMTRKCWEQIHVEKKEGTGFTKVEKGRIEDFRMNSRYPNYKAAIPNNTDHFSNPGLGTLRTFLEAVQRSWILPVKNKPIAIKSGNHVVHVNARVLSEAITTMQRLGYDETDIALTTFQSPVLITPKGKGKQAVDLTCDFILLMPVRVDEEEEVKHGSLYYDLDTDQVVTKGIGEPVSLNNRHTEEKEAPNPPEEKPDNLHQRLIDLGFQDMFTVAEAFKRPLKVIDLSSRWYDAYHYFDENYQKPVEKRIKALEGQIKLLKGKKDKESREKRKQLNKAIERKRQEAGSVEVLLEQENIAFQEQLSQYLIERAQSKGHRFNEEHPEDLFSEVALENLLEKRMIEPYYNQPVPLIADQIISRFFDQPEEPDQERPEKPPIEEPKAPPVSAPLSPDDQKAAAVSAHQTYYNSHGKTMPFSEFVQIEVEERENYTHQEVEAWKKKYTISDEDRVLWVSPNKWIANGYNLWAEDRHKAMEVPEEELSYVEIKGSDGLIIEESDDGDQGFLFLYHTSDRKSISKGIKSASKKNAGAGKHAAIGINDYLDRVIAHMHDAYALGQRVTKGQVEKLAAKLNVPNKGMMWEAVELSWLLWYKMLYGEPAPFERRLAKMIAFWDTIQPTYAYSDSSKELYKQYSTPCPIAAIIAQYTGMAQAQRIFEPSAGNGLLVLGADPAKTHVNEIDKTRLASLRYQQFHTITHLNAAQPFPEAMTRAYDVVVTNPPFARWEEEKADRQYITGKYFHNHLGLARNLRLEHLMAGLALHTMKDTGRAAIIIMGHIYFDSDGLIAKYRPFFNWLYRHYKVDDVINLNSFKLYNKQGAIERILLILVRGRKTTPKGVAPTLEEAPHLDNMVDSFEALWHRVAPYIGYNIHTIINQLKIALNP